MSNAILAEIGWDEGFAIPLANAENKALEDEILRRENEKLQLEDKLDQYKDRIQAMSEHMKNVRQALSHTQDLCKARERETEAEKHFKAIAERETGRLRQESGHLESELENLKKNHTVHENNISKATQKLDELRSQLNWDKQTLDAWLEESACKDEHTMAIVKYAQQDESRIKALTLAIEKKTEDANLKRKALDNQFTETTSAQIGLDKTTENLRQAHFERQELIRQWENTIEQMRKRDSEMQQCAMQIALINQEIRERTAVVREKIHFLESEMTNNKEYEKKIATANRLAAKLRQDFQDQESNRNRLQDELTSMKTTVDRAATDVEALRSQISSMKKDIQDKMNKLNGAVIYNGGLEEKLMVVTETALSVEERAYQMDQLLKDEERALKELDVELHRQREVLFRQTQNLQALRAKEKNSLAQLSGSRAALSSLDSHLSKLDQNTLKQQDVIYNQDFQIQLLERKMARLCGEINTEEKETLERKTSKLSDALEEKKTTLNMLTTQVKKLEDDIRCVRKETEKTGGQRRDLTTKIEELNLFNDTSEKELKKLRLIKQDTMVDDKIQKLQIKQLRDLLYNKADSVLSLETRRLELQRDMRTREEDIKVHRETLGKEVKITDQDRQGLSATLHERLSKIDKMRNRYEILTISMAPPEGEEERSQAYYIIKAAQEKEMLQREGDTLDHMIRKTEKEVIALENTIHLVNNCNTTYRKSFNKADESSEEYHEKVQLEEQHRAAEEKYRYKKRQIRELQEDIKDMDNTLARLLQEELEQNEQTEEMQAHIIQLNKEVSSQKEKLLRAAKQCSKLTEEIRSASRTKMETFEERDVELRELRDFDKTVNRMLLEAMEESPGLGSAVETYFLQANLPLPSPASTPASRQSSKTSSRTSSKTSSARSSVSLRSAASSASGSPRSSAVQSVTPKTLELGLGVTFPPLSTSPRPLSTASSCSSSSRSQGKSP